jgi:hypothetical protein
MGPTNKDSSATQIAGAHIFQAVQHPELDTLGLVALRNFLKKRARYLRLVAQNNKADGVNVPPITVVASIDPELLENLIDMEEIDAESVDDCTDESVMEYLQSTQERSASVTFYALLTMRGADIMRKRFCCNFLRKMTNLAGQTIDARCVDCVYIYIYIHMYVVTHIACARVDIFDHYEITVS